MSTKIKIEKGIFIPKKETWRKEIDPTTPLGAMKSMAVGESFEVPKKWRNTVGCYCSRLKRQNWGTFATRSTGASVRVWRIK